MSLSSEDVKTIAQLARLALDDSARERVLGDLNTVLALVEDLAAVDTTDVEPMAHPFDAVLRLRDDSVSEENEREALQAAAPATAEGYFIVPRVVE